MSRCSRASLGALALLAAWGLWRAAALAWICDDAFISLRYAENLLAGQGLVYNPGERVEGYTNLLWTLLVAGLARLGADPLRAAQLAGIAAHAWLALALAHWSGRRAQRAGRPFLPLAAGLVLVSEDFQVWATGGLETALFTALAVQALALLRLAGPGSRAPLAAGVLLALCTLTRPDGLLFVAAAAASPWIPPGRLAPAERRRRALAVLAPVALVLAVWLPWKLAYYGDLFPTAFYSKSAMRPYTSQGIVYVGVYLVKNWLLLAAALAALAAWASGRAALPAQSRWDARFFLGAAALYTAHVVQVGGDFMFARRLLPAVPFAFLALEEAVTAIPAPRVRAAALALALAAAALPIPLFHHYARIQGIGDERAFYPPEALEARRRQARAVGDALRGTPARVAFEGGMCVFGYYSRLPYLVEITGLTQYSLAKQPLARRGFIGHEKVAGPDWLTENRIHFVVSQAFPPVRPPEGVVETDRIYFGDLAKARIQVYSDAVMDPLRGRPDVSFVPIERTITLAAARMERAAPAEAEAILADLDRYYFRFAGPRGEAPRRALAALARRRRGG